MRRINVFAYPTDPYGDDDVRLDGWFDLDKAEQFDEATDWDGSNNLSRNTGSQWHDEYLYRTAQGRFVLQARSRDGRQGGLGETWQFVTDERAREWLLLNERDAAVERLFGQVEDERGPGRPEVGKAVNIRYGDELLARVDAYAAERGTSRADLLREMVASALKEADR